MLSLNTPLSQFPTVTKSLLRRLHYLGLKTASDLLFYFPSRYDDFRQVVPLSQVQPGFRVTVKGRLQLIANKRSFYRHRLLTEALLADETGELKVVWFNQPYLVKILKVGDRLSLAGKLEMDRFGLQMTNPIFEKEKVGVKGVHTGRLVPIYPTTEGLTQKQLRFLIKQSLSSAPEARDWLPKEIVKQNQFFPLPVSIEEIHFPSDEKKLKKASDRFKFEELFLIQLRNELTRREFKQSLAPAIHFKEKETKDFVASLPFKLTLDQRRAAWEILQDLAKNQPMNRLLNGEVGSGKTVVAAMAAYNAVLNGYQAVFMAPTEILAFQHYNSFRQLFGDKIIIALLTRSQFPISIRQLADQISKSKIKKKDIVERIKNGEVDIIIGTHALLSENVVFKNLGLAIVDEQHRFGVEQRKTLHNKSNPALAGSPHFLSMTATPIPRSYALALYGDLDLSLIKEMPKGRKKILTRLVEPVNRLKAYDFIRGQVKQGRQVFVICPLIEESAVPLCPACPDHLSGWGGKGGWEQKSVMAEYKKLSEEIFPDLRVSYLHGRMKSKEKEAVMKDFLEKKFDILVSTSVVEVGVDVSNASVMMIEGAERFGLSQLHQFRGRVGRSEHQSYCFLFTSSGKETIDAAVGATRRIAPTVKRLNYFVSTQDGFALAEKDLELRGPGEIFGTTQHGFPELKIADLRDLDLIKKSREAAKDLLAEDPDLAIHPLVANRLARWEKEVHLE